MSKKILCVVFSAITVLWCAIPAAANLGSGAEVIARDTRMIKSAYSGRKITFTDSDFKAAIGVRDFKSIKIESLPDEKDGTLIYAGRRASVGQTIKRRSVPSLVFIPSSPSITEATFSVSFPSHTSVGTVECILRFTPEENKAPVSGSESTVISVFAGVGVSGNMCAYDPDGDEVEFIIAEYPRHGVLKTGADGSYFYTPFDGADGKDSFSYVARDRWGNYSEVIKVRFDNKRRVSDTVFADMSGRGEYADALALEAVGAMSGVKEGERVFFMPDRNMTRAEFVYAAVKVLSILPSEAETFFDDDGDIPEEYKPYVARAASLGAVNGRFSDGRLTFSPNERIKVYEAAKIITELTGISCDEETGELFASQSVPSHARDAVSVSCALGLLEPFSEYNENITRAEAAVLLAGVMRLKK